MTPFEIILIALAAVLGGLVNAIAGGGTLITFPALLFAGLPAVSANMTNTVALAPGYLSGTLAQRKDMVGQERRLRLLAPTGVIGGLVGGLLLFTTGERIFSALVPYLILLATALLAFQDQIKAWLVRGAQPGETPADHTAQVVIPIFLASIYGGYFGAGLSVIMLAVLGLVLHDNLTRLNALKQAISFAVNVTAAVYFVFSGLVVWPVAAVMAVGAIVGGMIGGRLASRIRPKTLRAVVIVIGLVVGVYYLLR